MLFSKLRKPVPERDRVVVIEDTGVADIAVVYDVNDQAVYAESAAQDYAIPVADLKSFVGPTGRIFLLCSDSEYVTHTRNLASLQKSIVLEKVTHYQRQTEEASSKLRIRDIAVGALIFILVMAVIFKR